MPLLLSVQYTRKTPEAEMIEASDIVLLGGRPVAGGNPMQLTTAAEVVRFQAP